MKNGELGDPFGLIGCLEEDHDYRNLPYNVTNSTEPISAESCREVCMQQFFR